MRATQPDLMIVDLTLKDSHGLELIKDVQASSPRTRVLVISMHDEALFAERCLNAGARGYLTKQEATRHVLQAVRRLLAGEVYLSEALAQKVLGQLPGGPVPPQAGTPASLSDRELEVLELLGQGLNTRQIAARLHLDGKTVETYRSRIKVKLELGDASELLQYAIQWIRSRG
jgi:DNA-binding NarL/FixJ family response regulator